MGLCPYTVSFCFGGSWHNRNLQESKKYQKISKDVDGVRSLELTFQCGYCLVAFAFDLLLFSLHMPKMPCFKLALIVQSICKFH